MTTCYYVYMGINPKTLTNDTKGIPINFEFKDNLYHYYVNLK